MNYIRIKAKAKINLTLEVLNKRNDGYHNLRSVFQKVNLYDELTIYKDNSDDFKLESNVNELNNNDNIIYKTYLWLKKKYSITGIKVILKKNIPIEAGMAGGSTDCASFLIAMNKLFDLKLRKKELISIGKSLGADVVPCLYNKAVLAEGIGDVITKIKTNFKYYIIIIKPNFSCSTKEIFKRIDNIKNNSLECTNNVISALENNDITLLANNLYNVFEEVIDVGDIKKDLMDNLALNALLTGTGSSVYGIFKNKEDALYAYNNLKDKYEIYLTSADN